MGGGAAILKQTRAAWRLGRLGEWYGAKSGRLSRNQANYLRIQENTSMGFIRRQEGRVAIRFLAWHYRRMNLVMPPPSELERQANKIVDEAHRIARETGRNVLSIIKELVEELKGDFSKRKTKPPSKAD
jgi:hypothetical protein